MAHILFWVAAALLVHTYLLYPVLLIVADGLAQSLANVRYIRFGRERRRHPRREERSLPAVSLVVAAYNEVGCIGQKLENSLQLDYARERLEIIIGSDGSTDGTDDVVRRVGDPRVKLFAFDRAGKSSVLNRCIPAATGEIIVLSDANTVIDAKAIRKLVRHFEDPEVGAVCGKLELFNPTKGTYEESAYWTYESLIKFYEGKRGAVLGANGGLYAIRRSLFEALPEGTIVDDFVIPMRILTRGYRVEYEPEAVAKEETTEDYGREFGRRARIAAGNFQSLALLPDLLSPAAGFRAFAFWSHKVLRWCAPALMGTAFIATATLLDRPVFASLFALQVAFYALALLGSRAARVRIVGRLASVAYYFVVMNVAMAVGFVRFLRGTQRAAWERTARA